MFAYHKKRIPISFSKLLVFSPDMLLTKGPFLSDFDLNCTDMKATSTDIAIHSIWLVFSSVNLISWIDEIPILFLDFTISRSEGNKLWCLLTYWEQWHEVWHTGNYTTWMESNSIINIVLNWSFNTIHWPFAMSRFCENPIDMDVIFYSKPFSKESIILIMVLACWAVWYYIQIFQLFQVKWLEDLF